MGGEHSGIGALVKFLHLLMLFGIFNTYSVVFSPYLAIIKKKTEKYEKIFFLIFNFNKRIRARRRGGQQR